MKTFTLLLGFTLAISVSAQNVDKMYDEFRRVPDSTRTKVWWFHGENITTEEGHSDGRTGKACRLQCSDRLD